MQVKSYFEKLKNYDKLAIGVTDLQKKLSICR